MKKLTPLQQRFVAEYLIDLNGRQAAIRAGYAKKQAHAQASQLLSQPHIAAAVTAGREKQIKKLDLESDAVLRELARITFLDPRRMFDDQGAPIPIHLLPEDVAAAISGYEVDVTKDDRKVYKVKFWDKNAAAEKLMKHLGLFERDNKQRADPVTQLLEHLHARGSRLPIRN